MPLRSVARAHRLKKRAIAEQQKHSQQGDALAAAATARAELQRYIEAHKPEQEQLREALTLAREQEHAHKATATAARAELESIRSERLEALAATKSAQSASQHEAEVARSETSAARAEAASFRLESERTNAILSKVQREGDEAREQARTAMAAAATAEAEAITLRAEVTAQKRLLSTAASASTAEVEAARASLRGAERAAGEKAYADGVAAAEADGARARAHLEAEARGVRAQLEQASIAAERAATKAQRCEEQMEAIQSRLSASEAARAQLETAATREKDARRNEQERAADVIARLEAKAVTAEAAVKTASQAATAAHGVGLATIDVQGLSHAHTAALQGLPPSVHAAVQRLVADRAAALTASEKAEATSHRLQLSLSAVQEQLTQTRSTEESRRLKIEDKLAQSASDLSQREGRLAQDAHKAAALGDELEGVTAKLADARAESTRLSSQLQTERVGGSSLRDEVRALTSEVTRLKSELATSESSATQARAEAEAAKAAGGNSINPASPPHSALGGASSLNTPTSRRSRVTGHAAAERLSRSAAKLEAHISSMSGLIGEHDSHLETHSHLARQHSSSMRKGAQEQEEEQERAISTLRNILQSVKPFLRGDEVRGEEAEQLQHSLQTVRSLLSENQAELELARHGGGDFASRRG